MKTKPLKNKKFDKLIGKCYLEKDIKSAVEWLKGRLVKHGLDEGFIIREIDEAFEDVK